jgi:hypothetical protein
VRFVIKNPTNGSGGPLNYDTPIEIGYIQNYDWIVVAQDIVETVTFQVTAAPLWTTNEVVDRTTKFVGDLTPISFDLDSAGATPSSTGTPLYFIFPLGWDVTTVSAISIQGGSAVTNIETYNADYAPTIF